MLKCNLQPNKLYSIGFLFMLIIFLHFIVGKKMFKIQTNTFYSKVRMETFCSAIVLSKLPRFERNDTQHKDTQNNDA
jgi:hypothetical protein